ncbi:MAG: carboxypeptidase regulatory-like domain-containing protein [Polyangiaceae bacterium]|nr:carboxypeptidase regulatory-like domain-containing protein [Polyangiaceae bacterium]
MILVASLAVGCTGFDVQIPDTLSQQDAGSEDAAPDSNGQNEGFFGGGGDGNTGGDLGSCVGLQCNQVATCDNGGTTSLTGKVYDPSGTVPLYNAMVYVPNVELAPFTDGVTCDQCGTVPSGKPIAVALTDSAGEFKLDNVPVGVDIPLVVQIGKWRRKVTVPAVDACTSTPLDAGVTRLPRSRAEGDIPKIAIATGGWDSLECFFRRLGIDDSEFTNPDGNGRVHLYQELDSTASMGRVQGSYIDGNTPAAQTLWDSLDNLKKYDVVVLSCEGSENLDTKSNAARENLKEYLDVGGRVFASHFHSTWFKDNPSLSTVATWKTPDPNGPGWNVNALVDTTVPKGAAFLDWLDSVGASTQPGSVSMVDVKSNVASVADTSRLWLYVPSSNGGTNGSTDSTDPVGPKYFSFNTPIGESADNQCGRGVYTDIHASTVDRSTQAEALAANEDWPGVQFPTGCRADMTMTAQEKTLLFLMMDLASCIQDDSQTPKPPSLIR